MTQVRSERSQWNARVPAYGGALAKIIVRSFASFMFVPLLVLVVVSPLMYAIDARAMGPDDRGPPGGPESPSGGPGGPTGGPSGGPTGSSFGGLRGPGPMGLGAPLGLGLSDHGHSGADGSSTLGARGKGSGSRWNEEGFFDDGVSNLDHQKALAGVKSGRYRSLKDVILIVGIPPTSRIVRMELLSQSGTDVYSIIVRDASGRVERMTVDAETGQRIN